jgi:protein-tyrosine phosphatase
VIDLHCHLLPNIDDGSRSVEQSVSVLREFAAAGVRHVVLTPHAASSQLIAGSEAAVERRAAAFERLKAAAPDVPELTLGFEIMLDQPLPVLALGDRRMSLSGSRYYLVEFPLTIVAHFATRVLGQIYQHGLIPLVAHPERYEACSPDVVADWREAGAKIQLDATTLTRPHSRGRRARALIQYGLADIVAADNHGDSRSMRTAADYLRARGGDRLADLMTVVNPGAVIADGDMQPVEPVLLPERWGERLTRLFGG